MPISFSDRFNIDQTTIEAIGCLDVILDIDARFFIDPKRLSLARINEFDDAELLVRNYFKRILQAIKCSRKYGDVFWRKADELLKFKEESGTCIGYAHNSTRGNAIGDTLRFQILSTLSDFVYAGVIEPEILDLMQVFQENVGCDRISDLITYILYPNILEYSQRIALQLGINNCIVTHKNKEYKLWLNEYNNKPLLLLPKDILCDLPIAHDFEDIAYVCEMNNNVRKKINEYFDLDELKINTKSDLREFLLKYPKILDEYLNTYKSIQPAICDLENSLSGELFWYEQGKSIANNYMLPLSKDDIKAIDVAEIICYQYKKLIENNGLNKLLYNDDNIPKHESAAQLLFYGIALAYCKANNYDVSPEADAGRGPVDFKLSKGSSDKVVVEVKLSSNKQIYHGIETQLPIYMTQEETKKGIYLVIDNGHPKTVENFIKKLNNVDKKGKDIKTICVDATIKPSASKA